MRDEHITDLLQSAPLSSLSVGQQAAIKDHTDGCASCRQAYEATVVSTLLLRERTAEAMEIQPPPFFATRVLAALRERQEAQEEASPLRRLWRTAGALVSTMAATAAALVILTFFAPGSSAPTTGTQTVAAFDNPYSAEQVILDRDDLSGDQMSYGQVLTTLYEPDNDAGN